jgi:RNA polymerase primary sigma factor
MPPAQDTSSSVLSRYFAEIRDNPRLTKAEEKQLARRIQRGDRAAFETLIESNLSFVSKVASEYRNLGIPFEDLLNEGNLGLIEAAYRFDAEKDTKFISYAVWWIRKSILKALADHTNLVRVPVHRMKRMREVRQAEAWLRRKLGRQPNREEISERLGTEVSELEELLQINVHEVSLDEMVGKNEDRPLSEFLVDDGAHAVDGALIDRQVTRDLTQALGELNAQERYVINHRFGLDGTPCLTLHEIGQRMGVSRERVRQIENKAKARLQRLFKRRNGIRPLATRATRRRDHRIPT